MLLSLCADFIPWLSLAAANIMIGADIGLTTVVSAILLVFGAMITRYGTLVVPVNRLKRIPAPQPVG